MQVQKVIPATQESGVDAPHSYLGKIVCIEDNEQDHNLLANFVETCWNSQGGEDYTVSFSPTDTESILWISAVTQERLEDLIEWTIDLLKRGFEKAGATCTIVS